MLKVKNITIKRGSCLVVREISLQLSVGETIGIVGPNGSGKTTLLTSLNKILPIHSGIITVCDQDLKNLSRREVAFNIASVLQEKEQNIALTVYDLVALGRLPSSGVLDYTNNQNNKLILNALEQVDIRKLSNKLITGLSGGEQQRVMIARAIAQQANFLLLDEPTNHLDLRHQLNLISLIKKLKSGNIIVLHDLNLAAQCCDKIILMNKGKAISFGTPNEVLNEKLLESIYHIKVTKIIHRGRPHLIFDNLQ